MNIGHVVHVCGHDDGESRDPRGYRVCDQDLRVRVQVALPSVGIEPSEGATSASGVAHEIMQRMHVGAGKGNGSSLAAMSSPPLPSHLRHQHPPYCAKKIQIG